MFLMAYLTLELLHLEALHVISAYLILLILCYLLIVFHVSDSHRLLTDYMWFVAQYHYEFMFHTYSIYGELPW